MAEADLEVRNVAKSYGVTRAVDGVSFSVPRGDIFGLLGPNGAGKTSLIRIAMDIMRPDEGEVLLLGGPATSETKNRVGYLPEDRGLYQRQRVRDVLRFLGEIKNLPRHVAARRAEEYLDRVGLLATRRKLMRELSRGMQQKVQLAAVLLHEPDLLILDEPFSGLDPVNRRLVIDILKETAERGATVVLSTHLIDQVEALCREVFLIHKGRGILHGEVEKIREEHADNSVWIEPIGDLPEHPAVERTERADGRTRIWLRGGTTPEQLLQDLIRGGAKIRLFQRALPSLDEIFVKVVS
ncbi:MAG: ABC transporter ATP-binding protein [Planctomycetota bacterium]